MVLANGCSGCCYKKVLYFIIYYIDISFTMYSIIRINFMNLKIEMNSLDLDNFFFFPFCGTYFILTSFKITLISLSIIFFQIQKGCKVMFLLSVQKRIYQCSLYILFEIIIFLFLHWNCVAPSFNWTFFFIQYLPWRYIEGNMDC